MKNIKKKIISFIISLIMFINVPLCGLSVSYADGITDYNPALIPIFPLVSIIMIGSGIIARNAEDSLNQLTSNVINNIKNTEVSRSEADPNYNSPYRVINGGKMEKPNNNNKNGKWFGLGVASALGSAVAFEKGATEEIMRTVDELNGYKSMYGSAGIISADTFKTQGTSGQIALQLANISNSAVTQFDNFLHSDWFSSNGYSPDDFLYIVNVDIADLNRKNPYYPSLSIRMIEKSDSLKYIDVRGNTFGYYTLNSSYLNLSYYYVVDNQYSISFLDSNNATLNLNTCSFFVNHRTADEEFSYQNIGALTSTYRMRLGAFNSAGNNSAGQNYAYNGYKWQSQNPWSFTNNVYNNTQNFTSNFPDWLQESFNLLGQNVEGIRLGIDSLNEFWQNTQPNVQVGETPENVIAQLLNNYLNPEVAPDPQPDPGTNPDPDPDPDPKPYAPEVFLPFSEPELDDVNR